MEFSRQEYWTELPCPPPGDLPNPDIKPASFMSPALSGRFFTIKTTWEVQIQKYKISYLCTCTYTHTHTHTHTYIIVFRFFTNKVTITILMLFFVKVKWHNLNFQKKKIVLLKYVALWETKLPGAGILYIECILHMECSTFHSIIFQDLE